MSISFNKSLHRFLIYTKISIDVPYVYNTFQCEIEWKIFHFVEDLCHALSAFCGEIVMRLNFIFPFSSFTFRLLFFQHFPSIFHVSDKGRLNGTN